MLAIEEWLNLKYGEESADATEKSFAALDMFVLGEREDGDIDDVCYHHSIHDDRTNMI